MPAHGHSHGDAFDSDRFAAMLEVEGEVSTTVIQEAIGAFTALFGDAGTPVRRVADLGCGPGVATALLAQAFGSAQVLAVDGSAAMLGRAEARAERLGFADRVETHRLDLDGDLAALGHCDLAWAAMAVHHADDQVATLRRIGSLLEPHGLLCLLERADPTSIRVAGDLGRPGIWERLESAQRAWFESVRERMPGATESEAYPSMLAAAGLDLIVDRTVVATQPAAPDAATHGWIADALARTARNLAGFATDEDVEALRALADGTPPFPEGGWHGATVTSSRKLLIARPAAG